MSIRIMPRIADLPAATSKYAGRFEVVRDGSNAADASTGGGSSINLVSCDGSAWKVVASYGQVVYDNGTDVGIGTTAPGARLSVVKSGSTDYSQSDPVLSVRCSAVKNQIEFGHNNQSGYGCSLGSMSGSGVPYLAFNAEHGTNANTYRTRGLKGAVLESDLSGGFHVLTIATATADNQTGSKTFDLSAAGQLGMLTGSDPGGEANFAHVYAKDVSASAEVFVRDEAGNVTQISAHTDDGRHVARSYNRERGQAVEVDLEGLAEEVAKLSGRKDLIQRWDLKSDKKLPDWIDGEEK